MGAGRLTVDTVPFFDDIQEDSVPENEQIINLLNDGCEQMMAMGMTYEDYWTSPSDPDKITIYRNVYKRKMQDLNHQAWLQGAYVYEAVGALVPAIQAFNKKPKAEPYLSKPFEFESDVKDKERIAKEQETVFKQFSAFADSFNAKRKQKQTEVVDNDRQQ